MNMRRAHLTMTYKPSHPAAHSTALQRSAWFETSHLVTITAWLVLSHANSVGIWGAL